MKVASPPPTVMQQNKKGIVLSSPSHACHRSARVSGQRGLLCWSCPWVCADVAGSLPPSCLLTGHREVPDALCSEQWRAQGQLHLGLWHGEIGTTSLACQHPGGAWLGVNPVQRPGFGEGVWAGRDPSVELEHWFPPGTAEWEEEWYGSDVRMSRLFLGDITNELVRHFLIETSPRGVKLKGCANEPYFGECPQCASCMWGWVLLDYQNRLSGRAPITFTGSGPCTSDSCEHLESLRPCTFMSKHKCVYIQRYVSSCTHT